MKMSGNTREIGERNETENDPSAFVRWSLQIGAPWSDARNTINILNHLQVSNDEINLNFTCWCDLLILERLSRAGLDAYLNTKAVRNTEGLEDMVFLIQ